MTPDRRLDQIEPLIADVLQKVDRLIEGQGQILDVAVRADQNAEQAKTNAEQAKTNAEQAKTSAEQARISAEIAARGVAGLTLSTQRQYEDLKAGQEAIM